jgi:drug/metabolite transporter (DMT)-like permease
MALSPQALPALRGGMLALLAAALFGVSTPLVQQFGVGLGAFSTAALLYAGAAAVGLLSRQRIEREARLQRSDLPRLLAMAAFGAAIGPVALAWGLQNTSGTSASLMLTLEALFTAVLAWRLYHETMDGRVWAAMALLLAGGMVLVLDQGRTGGAQLWGLLAVLLATAAWGVDNTLSRALAERDPGQVVLAKALLGATATGALALVFASRLPSAGSRAGAGRHRRHRLRPEPALLPAGAACLRRCTHGLGVCLRALHRRRVRCDASATARPAA